jgi:hypothetical protein
MGIPHAPKPSNELDNAGGAYVRRRFTFGTREMVYGDTLTAQEVASIPRANLTALINTGKIELWPAPPADGPLTFVAERIPVNLGFGKWIVVEGRRLTPEPVTRQEAEAIAASASNQE